MLKELAKQATARSQKLQGAGQGLQLSLDQKRQLQEVANLREAFEKLKAKHRKQVDVLQTRVDTLGKDKSVLEERSRKLQEKNRNLTKEHKGNSLEFALFGSRFLLASFVLVLIVVLYSHRTQKVVNNKRRTGE